MKIKLIFLVIFCILLTSVLVAVSYRPDIQEATYNDLIEIDGLGETLSKRVIVYLEINKSAGIDDLINVKGIGDEKLKAIKKEFR